MGAFRGEVAAPENGFYFPPAFHPPGAVTISCRSPSDQEVVDVLHYNDVGMSLLDDRHGRGQDFL